MHSPISKWYERSSEGHRILVCPGATPSELDDLVEEEPDAGASVSAHITFKTREQTPELKGCGSLTLT